MIKPFEFYFDFVSPYSYLAHKQIKEIESKEGVKIKYNPILLGGLHNLHGIKVNGNQISNWDTERSAMKTLADPQTTLKEISEKHGWRQMLNIIDALPGKKYEPIPKFHKNIILLKAIKQYG